MKKIIVTCALPYANGEIHLGHLVEQIQADIWVRFNKLIGNSCLFIGADDTHGTPIMLKAEELKITPEQLISNVYDSHVSDFKNFNISYDEFYSTHSEENKELVYDIFNKLLQNNKIVIKNISQLYDESKGMFLPDRYIKGICPKCASPDQYGDNCESCGATYNATELKDYYSLMSKNIPVIKSSEHYFFKLSECSEFLTQWVNSKDRLSEEAKNKISEWLISGLQDWDISRDKPYFGFIIPGTTDKFFYVWLDAPVGYMSSLLHYCKQNNLNFNEVWTGSEIFHFIGKDILYFHGLFWPSVLHNSGYKTPDGIFVHGFLTINGKKMSKSRGTFITAKKYIETGLNTEYYRYYIASKSSSKIDDLDFCIDDFIAKINSELIGKFINIASRISFFLDKYYNNMLSEDIHNRDLLNHIISKKEIIYKLYLDREYGKAIKIIKDLIDDVNLYVDQEKPWVLVKNEIQLPYLHQVCTVLINAFRLISIYLQPIFPELVVKIENFLNLKSFEWSDLDYLIYGNKINKYSHMLSRVELNIVKRLVENVKE